MGWRPGYGPRFAVVFFIIIFGLAAHSQIDAGAAHGALEVAGRDRRYYSLTPAGRKQLGPPAPRVARLLPCARQSCRG